MNTLIDITGLTASDLFLNNSAEGRIEAVSKEALDMVFDITTAKGRDECISHAQRVGKTKTAIEKLGKALVDPIKAEAKVIDVERKFYKDKLGALQAEVRKPVTLWEDEQTAIKAKIDQHFFELEQAGVTTSPVTGELLSEVKLQNNLKHIDGLVAGIFGDRDSEAEILISAGKTRIAAALKQRAEADELDALRKDAAERKALEEKEANEKRIIEEHEAKKIKDAELRDFPAQSSIPEKPPVGKSAQPELARKAKINANILGLYMSIGGIKEDQAKAIIKAIINNRIPNNSISYEV